MILNLSGDQEPPLNPGRNKDYPFRYSTGRTVYHFHTRTKTGRSAQLNAAAPDVWVEMSANDAESYGLREGDIVRVESRRGHIIAPVRVSGIRDGSIFAPFHYGYRDDPAASKTWRQAANELTITEWDPVSKQPVLKNAAVRIRKVADATGSAPAPTTTASRPVAGGRRILPTVGGAAAQATETFAPIEPPVAETKKEHS
ncbi:molybdopterin dinucleotide binding domain-containing protein [Cryobacterium sp.]|jgi:anaerobic selenocysteine-containing dehydrogenase|uniref:molybdopterin dinucleotide binding domain-containing protein n=1 Tax=Cryobacterium sp. TaxID=1926290 RepID=UPI00345DBFA2|nr:Formate dehydrogenase subunit alpha [Cryobacterium sp.]